jgi:hypothetical protein
MVARDRVRDEGPFCIETVARVFVADRQLFSLAQERRDRLLGS